MSFFSVLFLLCLVGGPMCWVCLCCLAVLFIWVVSVFADVLIVSFFCVCFSCFCAFLFCCLGLVGGAFLVCVVVAWLFCLFVLCGCLSVVL